MATTQNPNAFKDTIDFLLDSDSGKGGYFDGRYLMRHKNEDDDKFTDRLKNSTYTNFVAEIVDIYMGFLWKQSPSRADVSPEYVDFMANADGKGGKIDAVLAKYQRMAIVSGTVFIIVDRPKDIGTTRANQKLPFLRFRTKNQLVEEKKDDLGVWTSVTFSEKVNGETFYRTFTTTQWVVSKDQAMSEIVDQGEHPVGQVPVVALHSVEPADDDSSIGAALSYKLAVLNWLHYNLESELRELERKQTFAILAFPVADSNEREKLRSGTLVIGASNGLIYDPTGGGKPEFIAPPPEPANHYVARKEAIEKLIYKVANLDFVGGVQKAGVSMAFEFQQCNSALRKVAELCETTERNIKTIFDAWLGKTESPGSIAYNNDFNMADLAVTIATAMDALSLNIGMEFDRAIKKQTAKVLVGNDASPDVMKAIDDEIDAGGDVYGDRLAQQAGL
jgi:hypothetical protein